MDKKKAFRILQIEETKNESIIRNAYRKILAMTNPEDKPEEFMQLREAYEFACQYCQEAEEEQTETEKTIYDVFMDKVEAIYKDYELRIDVHNWEQLFEDSICVGLDTSLTVREKMIEFLMGNYQLKHIVWKCIDDTFQIVEDKEVLQNTYPKGFLDYVESRVNNPYEFPFDLLSYTEANKEDANPDKYIRTLEDLRQRTYYLLRDKDMDLAECYQLLDELVDCGVYHPCECVERSLILEAEGKNTEADELLEEMLNYISDDYIALVAGKQLWRRDRIEEARDCWQQILDRNPNYYLAGYFMAEYLYRIKDYYGAREKLEGLSEERVDEDAHLFLQEVNDVLIPVMLDEVLNDKPNDHFEGDEERFELGWCLLQNSRFDECVQILENFTPKEEDRYSYVNLYSRTLFEAKMYDRALPLLEEWNSFLIDLEDDGTKETRHRMTRRAMASCLLGCCYNELGNKEKAIECMERGVGIASTNMEKINSLGQFASMYSAWKEFDHVVEICDKIIEVDPEYYPAYLMRQQGFYELHMGQGVIDDYYNAISIFPGYYRPYRNAAAVFFSANQIEDSVSVLENAKNNNVEFSPDMNFIDIKIKRVNAKTEKELLTYIKRLEELQELSKKKDDIEWDIEQDSDIAFFKALAYWDILDIVKKQNNNEREMEVLELTKNAFIEALEMDPKLLKNYLALCDFLIETQGEKRNEKLSFELSKKIYLQGIENLGRMPELVYGLGLVAEYEDEDEEEHAIDLFKEVLEQKKVYRDACEKVNKYYRYLYETNNCKKDLQKAIEYINREVEERPECYYYVERGLTYMNALLLDEAIADFESAIADREDDWAAYNNLGCCYKYLGQFEKAIELFEKSLECLKKIGRKNALPYSNMADCYEGLKNYKKAIECYELDLKEMSPGFKPYYKYIGQICMKIEDYDKAREALQTYNGDDVGYYLAEIHSRKNEFSEAEKILKKAVDKAKKLKKNGRIEETDTDLADRYSELASFYSGNKLEYKKAIKYNNKAMSETTDRKTVFNQLRAIAKRYLMIGDKENAKKYANMAIEFFENNYSCTREEYIDYLPRQAERFGEWATIEMCLGNYEKALEMYKKMGTVLRCKGCRWAVCPEVSGYIGDLYFVMGEYELAKKYFLEQNERGDIYYNVSKMIEACDEEMKKLN